MSFKVIVTKTTLDISHQCHLTSLAAREKVPTFDELIGILLQEEEWRKKLNSRFQSSTLDLMAKAKFNKTYNGKQWVKIKGDEHQNEASTRAISSVKQNGS